MALTGSGQISLGDIAGEFGGDAPHALSEYYDKGNAPSSGEIQLAADFYGTGATTIQTFTSDGTFTVSGRPLTSDILIIGGGGSGGGKSGAGGGAGGMIEYSNKVLSVGSYAVVVGEGGDVTGGNGVSGGNSSVEGLTTV